MSAYRGRIVLLAGLLVASLGTGCHSPTPQPASVVPAVTTVSTLPACTAANKGQVVFLTTSGSGTLETCNGSTFVPTACTASNIDQVLYIVSQATFEACTGSAWTGIPFASNGVTVGTGPDSIVGTVAGPSGPLSGATITLSGNAAANATTDANGHYAFTGLANGSYGVTASAGAACSTASATLNNITGLRQNDFTLTSTGKAGACASVTGPPGPAGPTGPTGANGTNGTNGTNGINGTNGTESLISVTPEPAGPNCSTGGQRIDVGIDTNGNGVLDTGEIQHTAYVCNGTSSSSGTSTCPAGTFICNDLTGSPTACSDHSADRINCGACGNLCQAAQSCIAGACVNPVSTCPAGTFICNDLTGSPTACSDHSADRINCGACGNLCQAAQSCIAGACVNPVSTCPAGTFICNDLTGSPTACSDHSADRINCGACGNLCQAAQSCIAGACVNPVSTCPAGTFICNDLTGSPTACSDHSADRINCGACGNLCQAAQSCIAGACVNPVSTCPAGTFICNDLTGSPTACSDHSADRINCGACGTSVRPPSPASLAPASTPSAPVLQAPSSATTSPVPPPPALTTPPIASTAAPAATSVRPPKVA